MLIKYKWDRKPYRTSCSPQFHIKIDGDMGMFARPEYTEKQSYPIITPSAAIGVFENILWKPAIRWETDKIVMLNAPKYQSIRRNEVKCKAPNISLKSMNGLGRGPKLFRVCDRRIQRTHRVLINPSFIISSHFFMTRERGESDTMSKFINMFIRRVNKGQEFRKIYMGQREFTANYSKAEGEFDSFDYNKSMNMCFNIKKNKNGISDIIPFVATIKHGVLDIPSLKMVMECLNDR